MKKMKRAVALLCLCLMCSNSAYASEPAASGAAVVSGSAVEEPGNGGMEEVEQPVTIQPSETLGEGEEDHSNNDLEDSELQENRDNQEIVQNAISAIVISPVKENETYAISLARSAADQFDKITFAVWSELNGQDDIKWQDAKQMSDGSYQYQMSVLDYRGLGLYHVHAYGVGKSGEMTLLEMETFSVSVPNIQTIEISESNADRGTFRIRLADIVSAESIREITVPVWSENNGQDDIVWYKAKKSSNGEYTVDVDIKNHKYHTGTYEIHAYLTDITGYQYICGNIKHSMPVHSGKIQITKKKDLEYQIELKDVNIPGGETEIIFPVWSDVNGQDDIKWYTATKQGDHSYSLIVNLKNHKGLGGYQVHAYAKTKGNNLEFLANESFMSEQPKISVIETNNINVEKGTFQVILKDVTAGSLVQKVSVPVWSENNGQDDIVWYEAKKKSNGDYLVEVDIKNHKYSTGKYNIHAYMADATGYESFVGAADVKLDISQGTLKIVKKTEAQYVVRLENVLIPGGINEVQLPVWSEVNGQDDLKWYSAVKQSDGTYSLEISVSNHKGLGKYIVHAYGKDGNGKLILLGEQVFETKKPVGGLISILSQDKQKGTFQVKISGIKNAELVKKVQVPIWSDQNQKDIIWYEASRNTEGDYIVDVNIKEHQYHAQIYYVHAYMTDVADGMQFIGNDICDMKLEYSGLNVVDRDNTETIYNISLANIKMPAGERGVKFAVWGSTGGQNDIVWYTGVKQADGSYVAEARIRNHKELGKYTVHAYAEDKGSGLQIVGATEFEVKKQSAISKISVTEVNGTAGSFKVTLTGVMAPAGIERVQIPMWCNEQQKDIMWYTAEKVAEGIYTATMRVENHAHNFGLYKIHAYITMGNGITVFSGATTAAIDPYRYVFSEYASETQRRVWLYGANAHRVQFPTWSDAYGQDDIVWYEGTNHGNGIWSALVDSEKHNSAGGYTTHVYVTLNGQVSVAGEANYSLKWIPRDIDLMRLTANLYGSPTPFAILVNTSTHKVGIFQGWQGNWNCIQYWDCTDGAPSTPTVRGEFSVGSRGYYFDSGSARCHWWTQFYGDYLFHSVLYNRNGTIQDGRLGMSLSHGCVRLQIDNAKWIYDTIPSGTTVVVY